MQAHKWILAQSRDFVVEFQMQLIGRVLNNYKQAYYSNKSKILYTYVWYVNVYQHQVTAQAVWGPLVKRPTSL